MYTMQGPLRLQLRPSRRLAAVLAGVHGVAIAALWSLPVPSALLVAGSALLAASAACIVRTHALRTGVNATLELELYEDCTLSLRTGDERWLRYNIVGSSFVTRVLTVLNLRAEGAWRMRSVLISADCIDPDAFRRLRVWLNWRCAGPIETLDSSQS